MAILVHDSIMNDYGLPATDVIVTAQSSISVNRVIVNDGETKYRISANIAYKATAESQPFKHESYHIDVNSDELVGNLYTLLYTGLKTKFVSCEDLL